MKTHIAIGIFSAVIGMTALSSCGLFRKKNRCNTCPKWNDMPAENASVDSCLYFRAQH